MSNITKMGCLFVLALAAIMIIFSMGGGGIGVIPPGPDIASEEEAPIGSNESTSDESGSGQSGSDNNSDLAPLSNPDEEEESASSDEAPSDGGDASVSGSEEDVTVNDVRWSILGAENYGDVIEGDGETIEDLYAEGDLIVVRYELENQSDSELTFMGMDLTDDQGEQYSYLSDAAPFIEEAELCEVVNLMPGDIQTCTAVYDVSDDSTGIKAIVSDLNMLGGEQEMINLGLE